MKMKNNIIQNLFGMALGNVLGEKRENIHFQKILIERFIF